MQFGGICLSSMASSFVDAVPVVNYERELKKLKDQIAATSDKEEKSKLIKRLNEVEKQHHVTDSADVWARQPLEV